MLLGSDEAPPELTPCEQTLTAHLDRIARGSQRSSEQSTSVRCFVFFCVDFTSCFSWGIFCSLLSFLFSHCVPQRRQSAAQPETVGVAMLLCYYVVDYYNSRYNYSCDIYIYISQHYSADAMSCIGLMANTITDG